MFITIMLFQNITSRGGSAIVKDFTLQYGGEEFKS
jgi:hypothetical protein